MIALSSVIAECLVNPLSSTPCESRGCWVSCRRPSVFFDFLHLARSFLLFGIAGAPDNHIRITVLFGLNIRYVVNSALGSLLCPLDFP